MNTFSQSSTSTISHAFLSLTSTLHLQNLFDFSSSVIFPQLLVISRVDIDIGFHTSVGSLTLHNFSFPPSRKLLFAIQRKVTRGSPKICLWKRYTTARSLIGLWRQTGCMAIGPCHSRDLCPDVTRVHCTVWFP